MPERLVWERDGAHWPHRESSRFVSVDGLRWHVQAMGPASAPTLLLIHGTGASTHSWRGLAPLLAGDHRVIAVDLPGHGFTAMPALARMSLPGMAAALEQLLDALAARPALAVGHSAGAAIAARMCLDGRIAPRALVAINGAMLPLDGPVGRLFSPMAKLLARNPFVPKVFAWTARDRRIVQRLLAGTGSAIDETGAALYGRLVASPGHAAAALAMMAQWDLGPLERDLPRLAPALHLIVGGEDRTVPPAHALRLRSLVPGATVHELPGLGHLAHEERPDLVDALIRRADAGAA
jgi:magnesium chelatase accessory protein